MVRLPVCDVILEETIACFERAGNVPETAKILGLDATTVRRRLKRAAQKGLAPGHWTSGTAAGYHMGKVTLHRKADGTLLQTWERQLPDEASYFIKVSEAIATFRESPIPIVVAKSKKPTDKDIIPWLQIGDAHIGMLASEKETGANFDISIAEREICAAVASLIDLAPYSERLVINDLGDGTHYETFKALTEASGHALDFDTRYWKMIRAYIRITCFMIEKALEKAKYVDYIANQGNHSRSNDIWIAALVEAIYSKTGRVKVLDNSSPFIAYRMGKTLVLVHHGDKVKPEKLRDVMSFDYAEDWGQTEFRYIDGGHVHHSQSKELSGVTFESWNNLAPADKYAHDAGWRSKQAMSLVLRSKTYGEVGRHRMPVEKVRDMLKESSPNHYTPKGCEIFKV